MSRTIELIRWTLERAAQEFDINKRTLSGRVKQQGILPGNDEKWSTLQICEAVFGNMDGQKLRKITAEAIQVELENAEAEGRLVDLNEVTATLAPVVVEMVRLVRTSKLGESEQDALLQQLHLLVKPK